MSDGNGKIVDNLARFPSALIPEGEPEKATTVVLEDQHTLSARQMVQVCLALESQVAALKTRSKVSPRPVDPTPLILDAMGIMARTQAFILDELLNARGVSRSIRFQPEIRS